MSHNAARFHIRFQKVLEYIDQHLDDDLSVEVLSGVAAFLKYHFHRQFSELFGIGVYKYVQLCRLKRTSYQLAFRTDRQVIDVALASGYEGRNRSPAPSRRASANHLPNSGNSRNGALGTQPINH